MSSNIYYWNEKGDFFDHKLDQLGVDKGFINKHEVMTR